MKTGALQNGAEVAVSIRPETIRLSQAGQERGTGVNRLSGKVRHVAFLGDASASTSWSARRSFR